METVANDSLKKIIYENLQQFTEDINRNFAIIQNSPLYKGIPGDAGKQGDTGFAGERGSHFYFVKLNKFLDKYPDQIVNGSSINLTWINAQLQQISTKNDLLETLGVVDGKFVNNDIVVLTSSEMIEYDVVANAFVSTGISFYQQGSLVTSIEQRIEEYVSIYVKNNPIINSLRNIFVDYTTYGQVYAETANTYITNKQSDSAILVPSLTGENTSGTLINNHKYFGYNRNQVEIGKSSTTVFGSMDDYVTLLNNGVSVIKEKTFTVDYLPNKNNIPTVVILQDTDANGILFGFKNYNKDTGEIKGELAHFGSIFKDSESISNIHIKSDQGIKVEDFSEILLNRNRLKYDKLVEFGDDLSVAKDFTLEGNFNNRWFRTAEFVKTVTGNKSTVIEVGLLELSKTYSTTTVSNCIYKNISQTIQLPAFKDSSKQVVLTVKSDGNLEKTYFIETIYPTISNNTNLNDITWAPTSDSSKQIITSKHLSSIIEKINNIQQYVKNNYWRIDEFGETTRLNKSKNNRIGILNLDTLTVYSDTTLGNDNNNYFESDITNKVINLGFNTDNASLFIRAKKSIIIDYYINKLPSDAEQTILTSNNFGSLYAKYGIFNSGQNTLDLPYFINYLKNNETKSKNLVPTLYQLSSLAKSINTIFEDRISTTWKKSDFTHNANVTTGEDSDINPDNDGLITSDQTGNIPNIFVKGLLGGKRLIIHNDNCTFTTGKNTYLKCTNFGIKCDYLTLDTENIEVPNLNNNKFVTTNSGNILVTDYEVFNNTYDNTITDLKPNFIGIVTSNANKKILTAADFDWLNNKIDNVRTKVDSLYYKKTEFAPENNIAVIPKLILGDDFKIFGTFEMGIKDNKYAVRFDGNKLLLGNTGEIEILADSVILNSWIRKNNELNNKVLVTDSTGKLSKEYFISEDSSDTENNDNNIPSNTTDSVNYTNKAGSSKTQNEHHIITGKQWKWLHTFIDNVKHRFINTFNKKETIDFVYDHMPVGSIVIWTYQSYQLLKDSLNAHNLNESDYIENKIPKGWAICDGNILPQFNGTDLRTPDLRNRFIRMVDTDVQNANGGTDGLDSFFIVQENLPDLTHTHNCEDIINEHDHMVSPDTKSTTNNKFLGDIWSNRIMGKGTFDDINNGKGYTANKENSNINKNCLEIPMVIKKEPTSNVWPALNYRHDKDGTSKNWRRYDFDVSKGNDGEVKGIISSNLTTIFENFSTKFKVDKATITIQHNIDNFNVGTGDFTKDSTKYKNQKEISRIPNYYKVIYIMKYDTRKDSKIQTKTIKHDTRYDLI